MLSRVIELSIRNRGIVLFVTGILVAAGLVSLKHLPFDAFPDTTPVQVAVNTVAPSLSPLEIERQITFPVEQSISGLPGLAEVRSISKFGFSQVTAIFEDGTDIWLARQAVKERTDTVDLPEGVDRPALGPVATGMGEVFQYLVESDELSARELRTLHHWVIRPQMVQVPGVAEINTWGGYEKQYHVVVDPDRLVKHDLSLDDVAEALKRNNRNAGGGTLDAGGEARLIQGVGLVRDLEDLRHIVVAAVDGTPIRLTDVAEVKEGHAIRRGAVTARGEGEAVLGLGFMLMGENGREVTRMLEERLAEVEETLPEGVTVDPVYSRTTLVDEVLVTVRNNLLEGALLVIAILFIFLGNLRAGLIVALAIPLSMLFAFNAMLQFGIVGSLMSLGAIDFGLVVDSSVIMVENAARRVDDDDSGRDVRDIVRDAALEVRKPTMFGELIIAIVYLPILTLEGVEGKLFRPMALTVVFALAGSMLLSVTVMPALASLVLQRGRAERKGLVVRLLERAYRPVLSGALKRPGIVIGVALVAVGVAGWQASNLGSQFVPRLREGSIVVNTVRLAGVSLDESIRYGTRLERLLLEEYPDEIDDIWTRTGTAEVATDPMGLEVSDVFITLTPREEWTEGETQDELVAAMTGTLEAMPGMRAIFTQPIEMRVNEMVAGIRADLGIKLFGDDFDVLEDKAEEIRRVVAATPGARDVSVQQLTGLPVLRVEVDREALGRHGIPAEEVLAVVEALGTHPVGEVVEGQKRFDLVLRLDEGHRKDPEEVAGILIQTPDGQRIPLGRVADVELVEGPSTIEREWARRRVTVEANVEGGDVGTFVSRVQDAIDEHVDLPPGYFIRLGGQFENLQRAQERLLLVVPLALLLVFGLLYLTYGRMVDVLRVFTGIPFAAVGGIAALVLRDMPFSISAGVGFVALSGVAVLGDMVLVSRVRQLLARGIPGPEAIREAARTRLRPVLMTGLVAALGFVPMALNTGVGAEVQRPLATVVIGGIATSTLATLMVLPVLYSVFGAKLPDDSGA
ncbi:MAG: efflux RND transporter permease subunit [Myxococcota bacterium]